MRILFATTANIGHFGPMTPFAHACAAAGHEVRVAAPASFADTVTRAGFAHVPFGEPTPAERGPLFARLSELSVEEANLVVVRDVFAGIDARAALPGMRAAVAEFRPDLVVRELAEFSSYAVAGHHHIPQVEIATGLASTSDAVVALLGDALSALGCTDDGLLSAPLVTVVPEALETGPVRRPVHRFRHALRATTASAPDVPGDGPLVYASFGTVAGSLQPFAGAYRTLVDVLAGCPVRALVTVGRSGDTSLDAPPHVRVEHFRPQQDVMPFAEAVVGHGGFGTTMTALAAGVPVVVVPLFSLDQFLNAAAVARAGAGIAVESVGQVGDALERVLGDGSYRAGARRLAAEMAALPLPSDEFTRVAG